VQKTASQWVRAILSDPLVYRHSGLRPYLYSLDLPAGYDPRDYFEKKLTEPFPRRTIATPLYAGYETYRRLPKHGAHAVFFVGRDPRDIVVSSHYSMRYSHGLNPVIERDRSSIRELDESEALLFTIERWEREGLFQAMRSWAKAEATDPGVLIVQYEEITHPDHSQRVVSEVLEHCDIRVPPELGRQRGSEDAKAHYRKGVPGDWRNHFTARAEARLAEVAGDLLERFGWPETAD
jgi:hypothetical protein